MKNTAVKNLESLSPSGECRMGDINVTYYRISNRVWFDKKAIEVVLTGKNQHNLLGQYKDPKNHSQIFDNARNEAVYVITKNGVNNYLQKARSVDDVHREFFYAGLRNMDKPVEKPPVKPLEPLQSSLWSGTDQSAKVQPYIKIQKTPTGEYDVQWMIDGDSDETKKVEVIRILLRCVQNMVAA